MSSPKIRLVCFDIGGVLVRLAGGWEDACVRAGVPLTAGDVEWEKHHPLMRKYERGHLSTDEFFLAIKDCLKGITTEQYQGAFDAWLLEMYEGAVELIEELKDKGVLTACLSNTNERHWVLLGGGSDVYQPLLKLDHRFASHQIGEAKPDEAAYKVVEKELALRGEEILFFDDREENVLGARQAGWNAEQITEYDAVAQEREFLRKYKVL
jgi:putative hydrolase of the HAD superfamily